jgi:hypothetical protein
MFTKFNQILLASGLVIGSAVILSPAAFADTAGQTVTATANPITEITWTAGSGSFTHSFDYGDTIQGNAADVGTVAYVTNVIGNWDIKASSGNTGGNIGKLVGVTDNTVALPYALKLGTGGTYLQPTADGTGAVLLSGAVSNTPVDTSDTLYLQIGTPSTPQELKVIAQNYTDTVTLTFTSGGVE